MTENERILGSMIDKAIVLIEQEEQQFLALKSNHHLVDLSRLAIKNIKRIKESVMLGKIGPSNGAVLGLTRHIGEWSENTDLMSLLSKIDAFYSEKM